MHEIEIVGPGQLITRGVILLAVVTFVWGVIFIIWVILVTNTMLAVTAKFVCQIPVNVAVSSSHSHFIRALLFSSRLMYG